MFWDIIKTRAKAFAASFMTGVVAAAFNSLRASGLPITPEIEASITAILIGWTVSMTGNAKPMTLFDSKTGNTFMEWFLQLINAVIAFFLTKLGVGAVS
jgi:uncharacterized membrane protein HdeD (DUF308 family)